MNPSRIRNHLGPVLLLLALAVAAAGTPPVSAQEPPRPSLSIEGQAFAHSRLDDPPVPGLVDRSSEVGSQLFAATATYPIIRDFGRTMYFVGATYRQRQFAFRDWPHSVSREVNRFHEITLELTYRTLLSDDWAAIANLSPRIATDFDGGSVESDDLSLQGAILLERTFSDSWTVGFGAAYASSFGQPIPIPLLSFRWDRGGRWRAEGTLPSNANVWYRMSPALECGLFVAADGGQYHVQRAIPAVSGIDDPNVQYVSITAGPALKIVVNRNAILYARGGFAYQQVRLFDGTDEINDSNFDLEPGLFVRVGCELSL